MELLKVRVKKRKINKALKCKQVKCKVRTRSRKKNMN